MTGAMFGVAAVIIFRTADPLGASARSTNLWKDSWDGLQYTWSNPTLRGLGFSISTMNVLSGVMNIAAPVIVLQRLQLGEFAVGLVFAVQGLAGMLSAMVIGKVDSRGRERLMLAAPMAGSAAVALLLLLPPDISVLILVMAVSGLLSGPLDVALFTIRQRRTAPEWMGRAFAVSMSVNYVGIPLGAALSGALAARGLNDAILIGSGASLAGAVLVYAMIPRN
jgi:predicted MFS family arabinose efflux permease